MMRIAAFLNCYAEQVKLDRPSATLNPLSKAVRDEGTPFLGIQSGHRGCCIELEERGSPADRTWRLMTAASQLQFDLRSHDLPCRAGPSSSWKIPREYPHGPNRPLPPAFPYPVVCFRVEEGRVQP